MPNPNQVMGQARITVNGRLYTTDGKSSLSPGGIERTPQRGDFRAGMFTEEMTESELECSVLITPEVDIVELQAIDDATVVFEADTGQVYLMNHAFVVDRVTASEGKAKLKLAGPPAETLSIGL